MTENSPITVLDREASFAKLGTQQLGRLVVRRKEEFDIFPVNYVLDGEDIYFRSAEGSKLFTVALNSEVLFEADEVSEGHAWSVVVRGEAHLLTSNKEIQHADSLPLKPWIPTLKYNFVKIVAHDISGREFDLGEEPERY
ncbi:pyridoxamine 5'-phosphate oxidase family protein [Corynebacterium hindlerae]|uniref:Pyridoxamine 5'-phosphate oxidase family protein n=1 Tax=Corynebacterium hindlerae TaxID=699041 RepID=A0A7G5FDI6_9CORY|nr:pyridoxamine 5'-phosphate oxidase family protein [Corynebacterium hindlerae]QMV84677.1 pyridoxamine 5'-phosphate oxidase family protein [Corynebacterium hindlerae]QTH59428.1 pyridoxamine 5'-phosphate oxidase family protein [Corynebacterium hindlerae]